MKTADYQKLTKILLPLSVDELEEVKRWITHLCGIARAGQVLRSEQTRPSKRGVRWNKGKPPVSGKAGRK